MSPRLVALALLSLAGCGLDWPGPPTTGPVITIQSFAFSPADLEVDPGTTITVRNLDPAPHSVTSEAASGTYTPGAVNGVSFDTGPFASGERTIAIPANAPHGTVVPYYCTVHGRSMGEARVTIR